MYYTALQYNTVKRKLHDDRLTPNFEAFADLQKQGLEPVRKITSAVVDAFEKIARKNHAFYGDTLDFAVSHAKLAVNEIEPKELFERQIASTKAFADLLSEHANEYATLGKDFQESVTTAIDSGLVEPVKAAKKAA